MARKDSGVFLEYQRMREEKEIRDIQDNVPPVKSMFDIPGITTVTSFPPPVEAEVDTVDGAQSKSCTHAHPESKTIPVRRHGARLCMVSAVLHMKHLANRKPKTIQDLRKNNLTTQEEQALRNVRDDDEDSEDETEKEPDMFGHLRSCRYLRGHNDQNELSIEEIFH